MVFRRSTHISSTFKKFLSRDLTYFSSPTPASVDQDKSHSIIQKNILHFTEYVRVYPIGGTGSIYYAKGTD